MLGSRSRDIPDAYQAPLSQFGAYRQFELDVQNPTAVLPQYLRMGRHAADVNVFNQPIIYISAQYPVQMRIRPLERIRSRYTFLPVGQDKMATFGSS